MLSSFSEESLYDYNYSKKSHLDLFSYNEYDSELYGRKLNAEEDIDLITYQNLLLFHLLNKKQGLKILQICKENLTSFEKLKDKHECWKADIQIFYDDPEKFQFTPVSEDPDIKIIDPKAYFDLIFFPSTLNVIPTEPEEFSKFISGIKYILNPRGVFLCSYMNIFINEKIWHDDFFSFLSKEKKILNKTSGYSKIGTDRDLFYLPENFYNKHWKAYTLKTFEEFGKAFCQNLFFENRDKLYPDSFSYFTYLKRSHADFYIKNGYSEELFNDKTKKDFGIEDYSALLIYSFITSNFKKGDRILQIGKGNGLLQKALSKDFNFYVIEDTDIFTESIHFDESRIEVIHNGKKSSMNLSNFFDFSFCENGFNSVEYNPFKYSIVIRNINRLMFIGGYTIFNFHSPVKNKRIDHSIFLLFLFNNSVFRINKFKVDNIVFSDEEFLVTGTDSTDINRSARESLFSILWKKINYLPTVSQTKHNNRLKDYPVYVFHHLMKCGGTSLFVVLEKWFKTIDDNILLEDLNSYVEKKFNINVFHNDICLRAHFQRPGIYLHERYSELLRNKNEYRVFTFIRDPLSIKISKHYFLKSINALDENFKLTEDLLRESNFIANLLPCDESNYKEVIDRYYFVGIVEKLQESFDLLADMIGKKKEIIPYLNTTKKDSQMKDLTPEFMKEFKSRNKLDYEIYDYCVEKFKSYSNKK